VTVREIDCGKVTDIVARLCMEANFELGEDVLRALRAARDEEVSPMGRAILEQLLDNARVAREERVPLCQDTSFEVADLGRAASVIRR
jgi:fumarate hydratase subunit alpha